MVSTCRDFIRLSMDLRVLGIKQGTGTGTGSGTGKGAGNAHVATGAGKMNGTGTGTNIVFFFLPSSEPSAPKETQAH